MDRSVRVGVLLGGLSAEHGISLKSGHAVAKALADRGWNVVEVEVGRDLAQRLVAERVDVAWIALHGRFGEDGQIQQILEAAGVPYTGSNAAASRLAAESEPIARGLDPQIGPTDDVARVLHEIGESFLNYRVVAQREAEQAAELGSVPELVLTVPYFDRDVTDLGGLLELGGAVWR